MKKKEPKNEAIKFEAIFNKLTTTVDGGWNITLSCPQSEVENLKKLTQFREFPLQVVIVPFKEE